VYANPPGGVSAGCAEVIKRHLTSSGVNDGLANLKVHPWPYLLLRNHPARWQAATFNRPEFTLFDYHTTRQLVPLFHLAFAMVPVGFFWSSVISSRMTMSPASPMRQLAVLMIRV